MGAASPITTQAVNMVSLARTDPVHDASPRATALARQALWNSSSLVVQIGSIFSLTALAFRQLSSSDVGAFALVTVTVGLLQTLDPAAGYVMSRVVAARAGGRPYDERVIPELRAGLRTVAIGLTGLTGLGIALASLGGAHAPHPSQLVMTAGVMLAACVQLSSATLPATALGLGDYRALFEASLVTGAVSLTAAWLFVEPIGVAALGIALLAGQVAGRGWLLVRRSRPGESAMVGEMPLGLGAVRDLCRHSGAIYLSSLAAQLLSFSDLWTVGALNGTGSAAAYRAGSIIPTQSAAFFYRVYDVIYPRLPRMRDAIDQERAVALGTRVFCAGAGCLFTALFLERAQLTQLLMGQPNQMAERVLAIFCAIWLVNVPAHGMALLLISRGQIRVMTPLVLVEATINILLSIALVVRFGPVGAAVGTLITMSISNLVAMPWIIKRQVPDAAKVVWIGAACCLLGVIVGIGFQGAAALALDGVARWAAVSTLGVVSAAVAAWLAAGRHGRYILRAHV